MRNPGDFLRMKRANNNIMNNFIQQVANQSKGSLDSRTPVLMNHQSVIQQQQNLRINMMEHAQKTKTNLNGSGEHSKRSGAPTTADSGLSKKAFNEKRAKEHARRL